MDSAAVPALLAPWRIGVDVGGTFTDMVLRDSAGAVRVYKAPSVPADPSEGVLGVLRLAAQQLDFPLSALLRDCALFVHGSTVATNTILEKKGAWIAYEGNLVGQGRDAAKQALKEKPELAEKIHKAILEKVTIVGGATVTGEAR